MNKIVPTISIVRRIMNLLTWMYIGSMLFFLYNAIRNLIIYFSLLNVLRSMYFIILIILLIYSIFREEKEE